MGLQPVHMGKDSVTLLTWTKILGKPTILVYIYILYSIGFIWGNLTQPPSSAEFLVASFFYVATTLWWKEDSVTAPPSSPEDETSPTAGRICTSICFKASVTKSASPNLGLYRFPVEGCATKMGSAQTGEGCLQYMGTKVCLILWIPTICISK